MVLQTTIPAVLDEEMRGFLEEIEEIDRVEAGKAKCLVCGATVAVDSIRLVVPLKNRVGYVDDCYECVVRFTMEGRDVA